jgi:hypothetical protein
MTQMPQIGAQAIEPGDRRNRFQPLALICGICGPLFAPFASFF